MTIDEISEAIRAAVDDAFQRGFDAGHAEAARKVYLAVAGMLPPTALLDKTDVVTPGADKTPDTVFRTPSGETAFVEVKTKRAPKGLTRTIIHQILEPGFGLPMEEVQRRATDLDSRISEKTVYNELYRAGEYYRDTRGHWRLLTQASGRQITIDEATQEREPEGAPIAH